MSFDDSFSSSPASSSGSSSSWRPCHLHTQRDRATKARDIAHLLDPSYSSSASPTRATAQVYVDHAGEAHDPDYRLFPSYPSPIHTHKQEEEEDVEDEGVSFYSRRASLDDYRPSPTEYEYSYDYTYATTHAYAEEEDEPRRENKLRRRRASLSESRAPTPDAPAPTTKQTIRRTWHALRLRTQVAAFRARRRVEGVVGRTG